MCVRVCARGCAGTCAGGVRFSNSNRITHSDYRILLLLKMHIPNTYMQHKHFFLSKLDCIISKFEAKTEWSS